MVRLTFVFSIFAAGVFESLLAGVEVAEDPVFLTSAGQVDSVSVLQQWRDEQTQQVHESLPEAHQQFALDAIEQEYTQRSTQLAGSGTPSSGQSLPAFLFLKSAKRCQTMVQLDTWHDDQVEQIRQHVPAEYQQVGLESIEGEYHAHYARLLAEAGAPSAAAPSAVDELPVLQVDASEYRTEQELEQWRARQAAQIERFVPAEYRQLALSSVDREFTSRAAGLRADVTDLAAPSATRAASGATLGAVAGLAAVVAAAVHALRDRAAGETSAYLLHEEHASA